MKNLRTYKPWVVQLLGNRRMGKSHLCNHIVRKMSHEFDLFISFMGSKHCNPELHTFMEERGFEDFQFNHWDNDLMTRLEAQQIELIKQGRVRNVLVLIDDITLSYNDREKLAHLCVRGRHFHVSVMMLSVSYSTFHKSCRRSCDVLFMFSIGCQSDRELLLSEFSQRKSQAEFYMKQITKEPYTCAVLDMNEKQQEVYWYRAPKATRASLGPQSRTSRPPRGAHKTPASDVCSGSTPSGNPSGGEPDATRAGTPPSSVS